MDFNPVCRKFYALVPLIHFEFSNIYLSCIMEPDNYYVSIVSWNNYRYIYQSKRERSKKMKNKFTLLLTVSSLVLLYGEIYKKEER